MSEQDMAKAKELDAPTRPKIEFDPRDENAPGWYHFLEQQLKMQSLLESSNKSDNLQGMRMMIDMVLDRVTSPDRETAKELLTAPAPVGLSEKEFKDLFNKVSDTSDPLA